jgi:tRNA G18 (ribose-2'-O)-methylase SpoU
LRRHPDQRSQGIFVAEGPKVLERLLQSPYGVTSLLLTERWIEPLRPFLEARPEDIPVHVATPGLLDSLTGYHLFQGALAVGRIPPAPSLDRLLADIPGAPLLVAAEHLASAENMGVLVRNCAALGAHALIVGETCASPFLRRAVRYSMGALFKLPILEPASLLDTLRNLRARGIACLAAHPRADHAPLPRANLAGPCCLVLGTEGEGLSDDALSACDGAVAIPMANGVDSLNVSNAGAVLLYEAARQRGAGEPAPAVLSELPRGR